MISFKLASREEVELVSQIAQRAVSLAVKHGVKYKPMEANMDITACHANGCPLRLSELLTADEFNFSHDIFGIRRHINRTTGQLEDCFLPRFAARKEVAPE